LRSQDPSLLASLLLSPSPHSHLPMEQNHLSWDPLTFSCNIWPPVMYWRSSIWWDAMVSKSNTNPHVHEVQKRLEEGKRQ
jgi:hypothetical protein